ncbi:MAG: diaminopimelate epimerase [Fervidobacterium sp.]
MLKRRTEEMRIERYSATGNSFVVIDIVGQSIDDSAKSSLVVEHVGERDGVIFVEQRDGVFHMDYFNRDGKRADFCGNGARTFLTFLRSFYGISGQVTFSTYSGNLVGKVYDAISVQMPTPEFLDEVHVEAQIGHSRLDLHGGLLKVGVPHVVFAVDELSDDLISLAPEIRRIYDANVNFFRKTGNKKFEIRTYERGVERETLSCGSGTTATACYVKYILNGDASLPDHIYVQARGGELQVSFDNYGVFLSGGVVND